MALVARSADGRVEVQDPFARLHAAEWDLIARVQGDGDLGRWMGWISELGVGRFTWLLVGVLLCAVDARLSARLALALFLGLWLREVLALGLQSPRPYWLDPAIRTFRDPPIAHPTYGLPSGHAVGAAILWFFLAGEVRRRWAWLAAGFIVGLVGVSRVYLGLHFPSDVATGIAVGTGWFLGFRGAERRATAGWAGLSPGYRGALVSGLGMALLGFGLLVQWHAESTTAPDAWGLAGASARRSGGFAWTSGAVCGLLLARVHPPGWTGAGDPWRVRLGRLLPMAAAAAVYVWRPAGWSLGSVLAGQGGVLGSITRFAAAAGAAWAAWWLLPWLFGRWNLNPRRRGRFNQEPAT
jgi:membrane-associated phospholipid phosphatase